LRAFDVNLLYYDPIRASVDVEQGLGVTFADLDELVRAADIVSLHLPLMPQTKNIIDASRGMLLLKTQAIPPRRKPLRKNRHGLKSWIEAAKKRLHRNVLAIALANKLARIAWSVLAHGRSFEASKFNEAIT
jgi:hypothetical protein